MQKILGLVKNATLIVRTPPPTKLNFTKHHKRGNLDTTSFVLTSHPTNLNFKKHDEDGNNVRPFLWEEIMYYYGLLAKNTIPYNTQTWIGFDMDRHQDERDNIFLYTYLQNLRSTLLREGKITDKHEVGKKITSMSEMFVELFEGTSQYDNIQNDLEDLKTLMDEYDIKPSSLNGHYRISADDLKSEDGKRKIQSRLYEIYQINEIFGVEIVSEIIIADCTKPEEIDAVMDLLRFTALKLNITPLIEDDLNKDTLENIINRACKKVMLAGSDSIQRDTYIGALYAKLKMQQLLHKYNGNNPNTKKTFFEGAGSALNRNGCILKSRMGTILKGVPYERTLQGQEAEQFIDNKKYQLKVTEEVKSPRCTIQQLEVALPLIEKIYLQLSQKHKSLQNDTNGGYTVQFNKERLFDFVYHNSHYGSRAKQPQDLQNFKIKNQRAITQSMIHNKMHFQPEMMYWDNLLDEIKDEIKNNLDNPIIQDMLNQYTALWQSCDLNEAQKWITDNELYQNFVKSHEVFKDFIEQIKQLPNCPKNLLLNDIEDHRPRFNIDHLSIEEVNNLRSEFTKIKVLGESNKVRKLLQNTGCGFSTKSSQANITAAHKV